jgi:aconitate hydratase 2/2-methylisocitrate dehydratase
MTDMGVLSANSDKIYKYLNFDQIESYEASANTVSA